MINLTSIDVNSPEELNLLENGVLLWETTVNHALLMILKLMELFHYLVAMMEKSFDHLPIAGGFAEEDKRTKLGWQAVFRRCIGVQNKH